MFRIIDIPEPFDRRKVLARLEQKPRWQPGKDARTEFGIGARHDRLEWLLRRVERRVERRASKNAALQHLKKEDP